MKRYVFLTMQGVATWAFEKKYDDSKWENVFSALKSLKEKGEIHHRVLSSSRKLLQRHKDLGFPPPTELYPKENKGLLLIWRYKNNYFEVLIGIDQRKVPHDYELRTSFTNIDNT